MPPTSCRSNRTKRTHLLSRSSLKKGASPFSRWMRLAIGVAAILVLWLAVLPRLADQPPVRRHIEFLEQRQIDPSAMFYTELEPMGEVRARVAQIRRDHPASFWEPQMGQDRSGARP